MARRRMRVCAVVLVGSALAILVGLPPLVPRAVRAQVGPCRSDPVVSLSDGSQFDLSATIGDDLSDVKEVTYVLHAPAGTSVVAVVGTDGVMGLKESFQFYPDRSAGTYDTDTLVVTGTGHVPVTATTLVTSLPDVGALSVSGYSGQWLHIHLV